MAYHRRARVRYYRHIRKPNLLNTLLFKLSCLTFPEFPMPTSRRNILLRTVAVVAGDIATAVAIGTACAWLIEFATLGVFLSFLVWLVGALAALAFSQFVVHPTVSALLCDHKLDAVVDVATDLFAALRMRLKPA
jgi:hypothetical protein